MSLTLVEASQNFIDYKVYRRGSTQSTKVTYASAMHLFIVGVPISTVEELTLDVIDNYIMEVSKQGFKPKTFKNKVTILRSFIRYLYSKDLTSIHPEAIDIPKVADQESNFLDYDEQVKLIQGAQCLRDRAIIYTLITSGLRVSELCNLRPGDLFERSIIVQNGKGGKARVTFITSDCEGVIREYLGTKRKTYYMFTNKFKEQISRQYVQRMVKEASERAGIDKCVSPHTLRHTFATNLLRKGARAEDVQPMMGHVNIATTRLYLHFTNDYLHERYDEMMAK